MVENWKAADRAVALLGAVASVLWLAFVIYVVAAIALAAVGVRR
jgi:hypothetical protein